MTVTKTEKLYLKEEIALGDHPKLGTFTVYRALPTSCLLMHIESGEKEGWYRLDLYHVADGFFDAIEGSTYEEEEVKREARSSG